MTVTLRCTWWVALVLFAPCAAAAQELPTPFFEVGTGDVSPTGGVIGEASYAAFNRYGEEIIAGWDATIAQRFVSVGGEPLFVGGEPVAPGATYAGEPVYPSVGPDGARWSIVGLILPSSVTGFGGGLFHGRIPVIVAGQPVMAPGVPVGMVYNVFNPLGILGVFDGGCVIQVGLNSNPGVAANQVAHVEVRVDASGRLVSERILAMEGQSLPGTSGGVNTILGGNYRGCGASAVLVVEQGGQGGRVAIINGSLTIRAGDPSPWPGRNWDLIGAPTANCNGDWALWGILDDGKRVIVKNGEPFIHEDELDPSIGGAGVLELRQLAWMNLSSRGRLTWAVSFRAAGGSIAVWSYFVEKRLIGTSRRVYDEGEVVSFDLLRGIEDDGVNAGVNIARFEPGVGFIIKAAGIRLDQADPVCTNGPTSLGELPIVSVHGSPWLADETEFEIMTRLLPPGAFALTLAGDAPGSTVNPAGSIGELCISGAPLRSIPLRANVRGVTRAWLHEFPGILSNAPDPGETWRFQTWYRDFDVSTGAPVSRLTEAVELMFR